MPKNSNTLLKNPSILKPKKKNKETYSRPDRENRKRTGAESGASGNSKGWEEERWWRGKGERGGTKEREGGQWMNIVKVLNLWKKWFRFFFYG